MAPRPAPKYHVLALASCPVAPKMQYASPMAYAGRQIGYFGDHVAIRVGKIPTALNIVASVRPHAAIKLDLFQKRRVIWFSDIPSSGKVLAPCNSNNLYTCNYNCSDSNLTVPSGDIVLRDYQVSSVLFAFSASSSSLLAVSTSSKSSSPSSTSTSPPLSGTLDENCTITSADHPPTKKNPRLAAVGAGIGVPLGLLWLATLLCFGRERRKTRLLEQEKSLLTGSATDYQQGEWNGNPQEQGERYAGMKENRATHEIAGKPVGSELQA